MRPMSKEGPYDPSAGRIASSGIAPMAIHEMGNAHYQSFALGTKWKEILPEVLWAYKTTSKSSIGETLFSLVYGAEALISIEVGEPSLRFQYTTEESNDKAMAVKLDLIEELREAALVYLGAQKQRMGRYYNQRTNHRHFQIGDLVLQRVTLHTKNPNEGKLGPNWDGPYKVIGITGKGSYQLMSEDGQQLSNNWNVAI
ncbi:uncharacterized protein LOC132613731 [Lycium barbarum]|uniref:uncharacterized protein LOC132613731 n=1 Tax=Lycium barbarum TaxID=112863 RepID=UPI00293F0FA4|nr:uncharacterized protein LOC132613731 [Lycium barbarum]